MGRSRRCIGSRTSYTRFVSAPRLTAAILGSLGFFTLAPEASAQRLLGYYPMWAKTQTPPYSAAQIPFAKLTHIAHAFLALKSDGSLSIDSALLEPALISGAHAAGVKVLISIGGADQGQTLAFAAVAKSAALRQTFARNVHDFVIANGYDGVDIDWEVPNAPDDTQPCILLMQALRAALPAPFLLSMAIGANPAGYGTGFDVPSLAPILDFINVMTYDFHGPWSNHAGHNSPMILNALDPGAEGSLTTSMDLFEKTYGVPRQKLNFGTAFYGYQFNGAKSLWDICNCGATTVSVNYGTDIKPLIDHQGWKSYRDNIAQAPYLLYAGSAHGPAFLTYDDASSTEAKTKLVLGSRKMGGMFTWEISADYDGVSQDLLDAMHRAFESVRGPAFSAASVTNGASFAAGLSPGSLGTIFGTALSDASGIVQAQTVPLPDTLMTTSLTVGGIAAPLIAVANANGAEQINFQVPWEVAGQGSVSIVVSNGGVSSQAVQVAVQAAQPGIFTSNGTNAVALHGTTSAPITEASPAMKGETIVVFATGLGAVENQPATGHAASITQVCPTKTTVSAKIGGKDATVAFSGLAPLFVGLYQVNLTIPADVSAGAQELIVSGGGAASNATKVAIQ